MAVGETLWVFSIAIFCVASMLGAINFIATTLDLRARGLSLMKLPLTCWAWFVTAILGLLSFAVLLAAGALLLLDRMGGTSFFIPGGLIVSDKILSNHTGGSPLLWQHLFWFFGHPEVYIAILPGMGVTSHILSTFARKPIFGYRAMVYAMAAIGILGFCVWGHHMFVSGMSPYSAFAFSILTMAIGVPSAIKTFNWIGTLMGGKIRFDTPMLYAIGFVSIFVTGGLSGIFLGQPPIDIYFHDTYFVLAHFHLIMGVAAIFGMFAGTAFWFPKMFGRMMNETVGKIHFWFTFVGVYAIFMPMHYLGLEGNPRRYSEFIDNFLLPLMQRAQVHFHRRVHHRRRRNCCSSATSSGACSGARRRRRIPGKPPRSSGPFLRRRPSTTFAGVHPVVHHGPYEFAVPGAEKDYVMQNSTEVIKAEVAERSSGFRHGQSAIRRRIDCPTHGRLTTATDKDYGQAVKLWLQQS